MANFYGIEGIGFIFNGPWADPTITWKGVEYPLYVDLEEMFWNDYVEEARSDGLGTGPMDPGGGFDQFMLDNADEVRARLEQLLIPNLMGAHDR